MQIKKETKFRIIAAIITVAIQLILFLSLDMNFSAFLPMQQEHESEEIDIPLDQIMEDLSSLQEPQTEKITEKTETRPAVYKQEQPEEPALKESVPVQQDDDRKLAKNEEALKPLPTPQKPQIEIKDTIVKDSIPLEIKKLLEDQKIAQNPSKRDSKEYAERIQFYRKNYRAIKNILKVYPYAVRTREIMDSLNTMLATTKSESAKKKMISDTEKMLFQQYESAIRTMSVSQGRVLLKMIARETNLTGYDIIKNYKGAFSAGFWYSVGKLFKADLKTEYHKEAEDSVYEKILERYEDGKYKIAD